MSDVPVCPVCADDVSRSSSMCFGCHLPIKDVVASQRLVRARRPWSWATRAGRRVLGACIYLGVAAWFAYRLPGTLTFVAPAAVAALWLHVVRGRTVIACMVFVLVVGVLPLLFWPAMWTDLGNGLIDWLRWG